MNKLLRDFVTETAFSLQLSQPMIIVLCSTYDSWHSKRKQHYHLDAVRNFISAENALIRRGLIENIRHLNEVDVMSDKFLCCKTTAAGDLVVGLLKECGLYVGIDSANAHEYKAKQGGV